VCVRRAALRAPDAAARRFLVSPLVAILILLLLALVILVVAAPLRAREPRAGGARPPAGATPSPAADPERAELEAAREAKFREIRDSELDYRTGKLSAEDHAAIDAQLRAEAVEILHRLDVSADERSEGADA
jgi:hypothetical protein